MAQASVPRVRAAMGIRPTYLNDEKIELLTLFTGKSLALGPCPSDDDYMWNFGLAVVGVEKFKIGDFTLLPTLGPSDSKQPNLEFISGVNCWLLEVVGITDVGDFRVSFVVVGLLIPDDSITTFCSGQRICASIAPGRDFLLLIENSDLANCFATNGQAAPPNRNSLRVRELLSGTPNYLDIENSRTLLALCLENTLEIIPQVISLVQVGEVILPVKLLSGTSEPVFPFNPLKESIKSEDLQLENYRSNSFSSASMSATSFDHALETFDEKHHNITSLPSGDNSTEELNNRKLPNRTSVISNSNTLVMSKEHMEIASSALALVSGFSGYEGLGNSEILLLLQSVIEGSLTTVDKTFYLNCLSQLEICKHISFIFSFFMDSSDICCVACECISLLCQFGEDRKTLNLENIEEFGFYGACDILSRLFLSLVTGVQSTDIHLTRLVCNAIGRLSHLEQNIIDFVAFGVCDAMNSVMESSLGPTSLYCPLLLDALTCSRNLCQHENAVRRFLLSGFQNSLVQILLEHTRDELVSINAIRVIIMMGNVSGGAEKLGIAGACNAIVLSMTGNDGSAAVVEWALMAIEMLLLDRENLPLLLQTSICEVLVYCLDRNLEIQSIARGSGRVVQILASDQIVRTKLGLSNACAVFSRALNYHMKSPSISQVCCAAIGSLAADNDVNRTQLITSDAGKYVINTLQKYSSGEGIRSSIPIGYDTVTWQACWALRKLSSGGGSTAHFEAIGICETLSTVGRQYINLAEIMIQLFRVINTLCAEPTSKTILCRMGQCGLCKTLIKCLSKHTQNSVVCSLGVEAITYIARQSDNVEKFMNARASEILVEILEIHSGSDSELTVLCCQALDVLAGTEITCARVKNAGGAQAILWALQRQMQSEKVVLAGCRAMCTFLEQPVHRPFFGSNGGCEIVVAALNSYHSHPAIVEISSRAIHFLALEANNRAWLGASGGCHIVNSLNEHSLNSDLCAAVCSAISSLTFHHEGNNKRLCSVGACDVIIKVMRRHLQCEDLIREGNLSIYRLAEFADAVKLLNQSRAIECIIENLRHHKSQSLISKNGFQALSRLSDPQYSTFPALLETKINSAMIFLLELLCDAPVDVISPGLDVIINLTVSIENCKILGEEGICPVLSRLLQVHSKVLEIVSKILEIVISLTTNCEVNLSKLRTTKICDSFLVCLQQHRLEDALCTEICRAMVQLIPMASPSTFLSDSEGVVTILKHLLRVKDQDSSILLISQLLTFLSGDQTCGSYLIKANGIKVLSSLIAQHINNIVLVQQVLSNISAMCFANEKQLLDTDTYSRITAFEHCEALSHSLKVHGKDQTLLRSILQIIRWMTKAKIFLPKKTVDDANTENPNPPTSRPLWRKITSMFSSNRTAETSLPPAPPGPIPSSPSKRKLLLDDNSHLLSSRLGAARICEGIIQSMTHHLEDENLVFEACELLVYLIQADENIEAIQRACGSDVLFLLFKTHSSTARVLLLLCPVLEALIVSSAKKNTSLVISRSSPSTGQVLCELGLMKTVMESIQTFTNDVEIVLMLLQLLFQLASSSYSNLSSISQTSHEGFQTLATLLATHSENSVVITKAMLALNALLVQNQNNISIFFSIADLSIVTNILSRWSTDVEIIQSVFWILKVMGSVEISLPPSPSQLVDRQSRKRCQVDSWINTEVETLVIANFIQFSKVDHRICQYGCDLLSLMLDSSPYDCTYFQWNEQIERCDFYSTQGIPSVLSTVFEQNLSHEEVLESLLLFAALLTRRIDNLSLRPYSPVGLTSFHQNLTLIQPNSLLPLVLRALERYPSHRGINRASLFLLNNLVVDHNIQREILSSLKQIWKAIQLSLQDPHALRYSCNLISTLASTEASSQSKLISLGAIPIVLHAFRIYLPYPQTVHDAILVLTTLSNQNPTAKEKISSLAVCESLIDTLEAYSLNESIAVEISRCIAILMEDSPATIGMRFNEKGVGQVVVGLLQSFGCGRESDQSAAVAEWCSRVLYCCATTPFTLLSRSTSSTDSLEEHHDKKHTQGQNWCIRLGNLGASETLVLVIEKFSNRKHVALCACKALLALSGERENVQKLVLAGASRVLSLLVDSLGDCPTLSDYVKIIMTRINQVDGVEG
jgi:hypothetical protein